MKNIFSFQFFIATQNLFFFFFIFHFLDKSMEDAHKHPV